MKQNNQIINNWGKSIMLLTFLSFIGLTACDNEEDITEISTEIEAEVVESEAEIEMNFEDIEGITAEGMAIAFEENKGGRQADRPERRTDCADVTHDKENKTITIDFGDGCVGAGGRERKGKVIVTYTGRYFVSGSVITTTFEDFFIDDVQVEGTKTVTNISENASGFPKFKIEVKNGKATWEDGTFATREVSHVRTWVRNPNPLTDEYHLEGKAEGIRRNGQDYKVTIVSKVIYKVECFLAKVFIPVQGIKLIERPDKQDILVDYGDGECDNLVTITVNGESKVIDVSKR